MQQQTKLTHAIAYSTQISKKQKHKKQITTNCQYQQYYKQANNADKQKTNAVANNANPYTSIIVNRLAYELGLH